MKWRHLRLTPPVQSHSRRVSLGTLASSAHCLVYFASQKQHLVVLCSLTQSKFFALLARCSQQIRRRQRKKSIKMMLLLVGMTGFEPATSCSQSKRATNCATSRKNEIYCKILKNNRVHEMISRVSEYSKLMPVDLCF